MLALDKMSAYFKMLALYQNVGALWNCWRTVQMLVSYGNDCALLKCCRPMKMLAFYGNVGTLYNTTCKNLNSCPSWPSPYCWAWQNSTVTALLCSRWWLSSSLEGVVPPCVVVTTSYHMLASLYRRTAPVPAQCQRSIQMLARYSNVGSRHPIKNHWKWAVYISATRHHIRKQQKQKVLRIVVLFDTGDLFQALKKSGNRISPWGVLVSAGDRGGGWGSASWLCHLPVPHCK